MAFYTLQATENLMSRYTEKGGEVHLIEEGVLGLGTVVCTGENLKSCVIRETYVSPWSSTHSVRFYRKLPKKYADLLIQDLFSDKISDVEESRHVSRICDLPETELNYLCSQIRGGVTSIYLNNGQVVDISFRD